MKWGASSVNAEQVTRAALVIGTSHAYQRHQDKCAEQEQIRADFEKLVRVALRERDVGLVAEEAGDKKEVHARLKADEARIPDAFAAFRDEIVDEPPDTIAKLIADELLGGNYVDIRPPGAAPLPADADQASIAERDEAMATKLMASLGSSTSVLVICGARHRGGLVRQLQRQGFKAVPHTFPENLDSEE
jgi:pheromone shutdown protein TraB